MRTSRLLLATSFLFVVLAATPLSAADPPAALLGDWAGWAYLEEAGDLPLRLRIEADPADPSHLVARFDELVSKRYDLPVTSVEWDAPRVVLVRERPGGTAIRLDGELFPDDGAGAIRGRIEWAGYPGDFELTRSPERLSRIAPERYEDCEGSYRLRRDGGDGSERTLVVGSRFWGELLFTDVASGRFGTLFPVDRDRFFAGSAMYLPAPVHARVAFTRDDEGNVSGLEWREEASGDLWTGERIAIVEEEVSFTADDGTTFAGTLMRPDVPGPLPAVVILGGSNWQERGSVRPDAAVFAAFGLAVLTYDKRGFGESGASRVDPVVPFRRTADDALAAVGFLRGRSDVIAGQVGLAGRSRGGWLAPLAAAERDDVAFLLLFVAPAVSPAAQETTRRLNELRDAGAPEARVAAAEEALRLGWRYGESGEGWEEYAAARAAAVAAGVDEDLLEAGEPAEADPDAWSWVRLNMAYDPIPALERVTAPRSKPPVVRRNARGRGDGEPAEADPDAWSWVRLNMAYDPIPALERVTAPVFALFGGADRNVVPEENVPLLRAAFERAGNRDFELVVVPGANHGLRVVPAGPEGASVPPHRQIGYGDGGWSRVERWLGDRFDLWGRGRPGG